MKNNIDILRIYL